MTDNKVKVAMVGLGFGAEFIPIYQRHPHAEMYAICQRTESKLNEIGDALGVEKRYTNYDDVLADSEVDFVHINSPIPDHAPMSIAALEAGKHVFCQARMCNTLSEARDMLAAAEKHSDLVSMICSTPRVDRVDRYIKKTIDDGELGEIRLLIVQHLNDQLREDLP